MSQSVERWDICMHLHSMSDFGGDGKGGFHRSRTNNAECYLHLDHNGKKHCHRRGVCIKAILQTVKEKEAPCLSKKTTESKDVQNQKS